MAIIGTESGYNELAIHDNSLGARDIRVSSPAEAASVARGLILAGHSIDLGLGQINSANLERLGLSVKSVFDPCVNLGATSAVLRAAYADASGTVGEGKAALRLAFSAYNSGNWGTGFRNGYVARVEAQARTVPSVFGINGGDAAAPPGATLTPSVPHPAWDVFGDLTQAAASTTIRMGVAAGVVTAEPLPSAVVPTDSRHDPPLIGPDVPVQEDGPVSLVRAGPNRFGVR